MAGLNETPSGERVQIALFGRRNAGKSSLLNALAGQDLAIVSETRGTTTDPVKKAMELLPLGPVTLIDTPGLDDEGELGELRIKKTREVLRKTDLALMVLDATEPETGDDRAILEEIRARGIPYLIVLNKADLRESQAEERKAEIQEALVESENRGSGQSAKPFGKYGFEKTAGAESGSSGKPVAESGSDGQSVARIGSDGKSAEDSGSSGKPVAETGIDGKSVAESGSSGKSVAESESDGKSVANGGEKVFSVSCLTKQGIRELKDAMAGMLSAKDDRPLIRDLLSPGDVVVLVVPIDKAAPKGRLILPQQQTIRDILEAGAQALVTRDTELAETLEALKRPPRMVVTDSQAFEKVDKIVPADVPLTSFSILMARYKGDLLGAVSGARAVKELKDGDPVLIAEGCTHHRQCGDIGTEKLPGWIRKFAGCEPDFSWVSGVEFPEDLGKYKLVVHCGGCMLNAREMQWRLGACKAAGVPATNYGTLIAYIHGILDRSVAIFEA